MSSIGIQFQNDAHWLPVWAPTTDSNRIRFFRGKFIQNGVQQPQCKSNFWRRIIELTQRRQDLLNKNATKSEKDAKVKLEAYLKACQIENYEEWVNFSDDKLYDLLVMFRFGYSLVIDKILFPKVCPGIRDLPLSAWSQNSYTNSGSRLQGQISYTPTDLRNKC